MNCIEISQFGGPEVLRLVQRPLPVIKDHEVLIKLAAAGVNRPDLLQRAGHYPVPANASDLPGLELSGVIMAIGAGVGARDNKLGLKLGDAVVALSNGGGYAEYCAVPVGQVLPHPPQLSMIEAAALAETVFTVWYNVFMRCHLSQGESFLVHGAASGIGTTAIQLAKAQGARVFATASGGNATASGGKKLALCRKLGADMVIDRDSEDFVAICRHHTDNHGIDVVLDMVGGDYTLRNLEVLAMDGRLAQIAFLRGNQVAFDLNLLMRKRLTVTGSTLRPQSDLGKAKIAHSVYHHVWPMIAAGQLRPVIDRLMPLAAATAAHQALEAGEVAGKIVLVVDDALAKTQVNAQAKTLAPR
ncbi:MAG: NAD(P)H-quinone oxidoreductase [Candidatus Symbiobacter sp.]|nr:NAD(P)H-quinone oxidoreductase [Candidatus Symbiobacter sp.]